MFEDAWLASPGLVHGIAAVAQIDSRITALAKEDEASKRLMSVPGVGSLTTSAAFAPENFRSGHHFAACRTPNENNMEARFGWIWVSSGEC